MIRKHLSKYLQHEELRFERLRTITTRGGNTKIRELITGNSGNNNLTYGRAAKDIASISVSKRTQKSDKDGKKEMAWGGKEN